jgi:RND family efflux transporter MFP subunit
MMTGTFSLPRPVASVRAGAAQRWGRTVLGTLIAALAIAGCDRGDANKGGKKPRVLVTTPITEAVLDYQDFTGRLEAIKTADIKARVTGYVMEAPFKEGDLVKEGALLYLIDPRFYQSELNQAEANLKVALAERNFQTKNAERARRLLASRAIAAEDYETAAAANEKAIASVGAMQAAKEKAQLYLDWTRVTAPFTGRISRRYADPGNLINADNTVLTTLVTEEPMYAYFDVDERTYIGPLASMGLRPSAAGIPLRQVPVMMRLASEEEFEKDKVGVVDFVDNRVIATTGTVRMRGRFHNSSGLLKAGLFVRIRLPIGSPYRATLIPDEAIESDQERKYVWVVNDKNEVEYRSVKLGQSIREWRVIRPPEKGQEGKEGLAEGDRVITSGMQRVRKGSAIEAELAAPPPRPDLPLVRLYRQFEIQEQQADGGGRKETMSGP